MKVSDYIVALLEQKQVTAVFELSGGMIAHLLDSLCRRKQIRVVSMHHEQAAAFAADGYGRMTGRPGVALATSGPGAINLLTGLGSCHFDSSPAVFITGQVNRHEQKGDRSIRQLGFQETDIVSMAQPIAKAAWRVTTAEEIPALFERAFALATSGRPGPVLVDVPMDIQRADISPPDAGGPPGETPPATRLSEAFWEDLGRQMRAAQRPLLLVGGGIRSGWAAGLLREFALRSRIPVVHSLMAVDALPYSHPLRVGMIGSYGNRWANWALGMSDFLLVLGSRLDVRQTGSETETFQSGRVIVHVDCDPGEVNNRVTGCVPVLSSLTDFLAEALKRVPTFQLVEQLEWAAQIAARRAEWPDAWETAGVAGINPNQFMHSLSRASSAACAYVVDVGQHQMWAAQSLELAESQRFLTSGGMGAMGFALPAAVGAAFARPDEPVVVLAGDGGFQCNIQELQTIQRNQLPLKIVVLNNQCHGMVRQFQESYFDSRYQSTLWGYSAPDFAKVAAAFGLESRRLEAPDQVDEALRWLWSKPRQPMLLEVAIATSANVYPKMAYGRPITEMEPFFKPKGMEGT
ncbi:MAG: thiamine pyrophosphate-binding protein [Verrucomicrobia bacterium]|nr:thiamine pyrophosphate-binding protein [Verrucomicrobiota bacterium]